MRRNALRRSKVYHDALRRRSERKRKQKAENLREARRGFVSWFCWVGVSPRSWRDEGQRKRQKGWWVVRGARAKQRWEQRQAAQKNDRTIDSGKWWDYLG